MAASPGHYIHPSRRLLRKLLRLRSVAQHADEEMKHGASLFILRCSDGIYYVGTTRTSLESRVAQHKAGTFHGYTLTRSLVVLICSQWFARIADAIEDE